MVALPDQAGVLVKAAITCRVRVQALNAYVQLKEEVKV
jgi:hypothetical protein